jgi:beta-glucosidase
LPPDTDASLQSLAAGVDQDLGGFSFGSLIPASHHGLVPAPTADAPHGIDVAAANVLRAKFSAGLFDHPYTDEGLLETVDSDFHRSIARAAIVDGATLLQNIGNVLPRVLANVKKVAVVGPLSGCASGETLPCAAQHAMAGGYYPDPTTSQIITVADGIASRLPSGAVDVVVNTGDAAGVTKAAAAAKAAGFAVVVVGDTEGSCGESEDRMELDLLGNQLDLLEAVLATGTPTLTVLVHGRPATFGE